MCVNCIDGICQNKCVLLRQVEVCARCKTKATFNDASEGYYAVIWHYEGESPTLFTCRAESKDEAEFLFNADMIDHESNHVMEFYIDSIEPLKL